ncbi:amidase [Labrys monachus]|uniref:Aspartyl-tRNA(Asn)/glutamyl-tRNA(Gln) amidotransferase subunit A n=1 Tax=Labrys monachus TaxID=217067 RepID=A0ABU0FLK3_9HYPH|nr:amidase [Labrys monachus]MDQ0394920.1 aspartyl-tRNA(Asn)/glutamyl-tRNA(Gln) amidotransferase subunit A [Labrys monachus]
MLTTAELASLDARTIATDVAARRRSPVEVTEASLAAIEALNPRFHAFVTIAADEALATARAMETAIMQGERAGPLAGVPVPVKDLVLTRGMRTAFGSRLYEHFIPDADDIVVERLRAAGAIIIGKTNVSEFGFGGFGHNPLFPTTRNPWNPALTSGGSSAGSAVAVATGIAPMAVGSDGGGSVRLPAAFNGLFGMKASMGRVPLWPGCRDEGLPGVSGWETIEHIGPITRTVADAALMLSVIAGPDPRDRHSIPGGDVDWALPAPGRHLGLRIAYCADWGGRPLDREVRDICARAARAFADDLGCTVEEKPPPFGWEIETFRAVVAMDTDLEGLRRLRAEQGNPALSAGLARLLGAAWTAEAFIAANFRRKAAANAMARFMAGYDLLLTPTVSTLPFPIDRDGPGEIDGRPVDDDAWTPTAFPANLTGQPAASVPAGWSRQALPVGLQIMGRHLDDATVLKAAAAFEAVRPWKDIRPPI